MAKKAIKGLFILLIVALFVVVALLGLRYYLHARYPLQYQELISMYAAQYGLDPYFVASVIWAESRYEAQAISRVGAVGLMQIMPETGTWIAQKLGIQGHTEQDLYTPEVNISFGCWYLSYLTDKFDGDEVKILAGYNAGPSRVEQWQEQWGTGFMPSAEDIPFEETKSYVSKIQKVKKLYIKLYQL